MLNRCSRSVVAVAALLSTLAAWTPYAARAQMLDRIVAVVNDDIVLQSELDNAIQIAQAQIHDRGLAPPPEDVLRSQVLERMILTRVQTDHAKDAGIRVEDRELNEVVNNIAQQNHLSQTDFQKELAQEGIEFSAFRNQIREQIIIQRLRQKEVASRVVITDQDVDLYLASNIANDNTEYRLSHILISIPDGSGSDGREKARKRAADLLKRARGGEDFAQLAIANSDGQQALQGGDLDWRKGSNLPTLFAAIAPQMQIDQISDLIETPSGFNIIKLTGRRNDDARQVVTETKAEHILLQPNKLRDEDATRLQAQDLYQRLKNGADFAALARDFSDDPGSKNAGGDLGWTAPGVFAPEFQRQIDKLRPGELSEPFRTQFGWHIAKVLDRRTRDTTDENRRNRARQAIFERKEAEEYDAYVRRMRAEAYVEYRLNAPTANGGA